MSLKDKLKARSAKHKTINYVPDVAKKVNTKSGLKGALAARKKERAIEADPNQITTVFTDGLVKVWSFSELKNFEACPLRTYFNKVDKIPQKEQEPNVGADRGSKIHDHCEEFVRGVVDELRPTISGKRWKADGFQRKFEELRDLFNKGKVFCEENWGIRKDWSPCEWSDPQLWGRAKLDAFVGETATSCRIVDYKTGRKFGNEISHGDQGMSYALNAMMRYPEITSFTVEFWYSDHNEFMVKRFPRQMLLKFLKRYHGRAMKLTTAQRDDFKARPSIDNCRWCPYGSGKFGNGHCKKDINRVEV